MSKPLFSGIIVGGGTMYLVSACLVGINCRYDGKSTLNKDLEKLLKDGKAIVLCPEVLGGLDTPREPCEIRVLDGERKVVSKSGRDCTDAFKRGADIALQVCKAAGITEAILQNRSPSCGCGKIYDGSFSGKLIDGNGMTAELLKQNGIRVFNEDNWKK